MKTLYIDVYFLINLTVDILSLYFSALLTKVRGSTRRFILSAILGSLVACLVIFISDVPIVRMLISIITLALMILLAIGRINIKRWIKFLFGFLIFEALIGGIITFLWELFDKYLSEFLKGASLGGVNRKFLYFSITVLLSIGVFKMIVSFFSNIESEGSVKLEITFLGKTVMLDAFVDSGNLAKDPMDMSPILLLKESKASELFPMELINLKDPDNLDRRVRKRIRLIPISTVGRSRVLIGVKADTVRVIKEDLTEELNVTVAIDKEGGDYGGYYALLPSAVL